LIDSVSVSAATKHIKAIKLKIIYQISIYSCKVIIIICLNKYEIIDVPEQRKELERGPDNNTQNSFTKTKSKWNLYYFFLVFFCVVLLFNDISKLLRKMKRVWLEMSGRNYDFSVIIYKSHHN
jgi:hypothetical protein